MCFVWIWEQTEIISLYSIDWLVFVTETVCLLRGTFYILRSAHTVYLCVLCGSENKQRWFHCAALTNRCCPCPDTTLSRSAVTQQFISARIPDPSQYLYNYVTPKPVPPASLQYTDGGGARKSGNRSIQRKLPVQQQFSMWRRVFVLTATSVCLSNAALPLRKSQHYTLYTLRFCKSESKYSLASTVVSVLLTLWRLTTPIWVVPHR